MASLAHTPDNRGKKIEKRKIWIYNELVNLEIKEVGSKFQS